MKISKDAFKSLVKECLREILAEGLGDQRVYSSDVSPRSNDVLPENKRVPLPPPPPRRPTKALSEAVKRTAGGDPLMASILEHTAQTTLKEMVANGDSSPIPTSRAHGVSSVEQVNGSPDEIFGSETAGRWSDLAFGSVPSKRLSRQKHAQYADT